MDAGGIPTFARLEESVAIVGAPRSGKTNGLLVPSVSSFPGPAIVASVRSDLRDQTVASRTLVARHFGGAIHELDCTGGTDIVTSRIYWDPIFGCTYWPNAVEVAGLLVQSIRDANQSHWRDSAAKLLAPLLYAAAHRGDGMLDVVHALSGDNDLRRHYEDVLSRQAESAGQEHHPLASVAPLNSYRSVVSEGATATEERASIFSSLTTALRMFGHDPASVRAAPDGSIRPACADWSHDFSLRDFLCSFGTLYISVPSGAAEAWQPFVVTLIEATRKMWLSIPPGHRPASLGLFLDEAAHISRLPKLPEYMNTGGGDGIHLNIAFQHSEQAEKAWGGRNVIASATHQLITPGTEDPYAFDFAKTAKMQEFVEPIVRPRPLPEELEARPVAGPERLAAERRAIERELRRHPSDMRQTYLAVGLRAVAERRAADGIGIRMKYLRDTAALPALHNEIFSLTEVEWRIERRPRVEPNDIRDPPPGTMFRKSGTELSFPGVRPCFSDPFWKRVLLPAISRASGVGSPSTNHRTM